MIYRIINTARCFARCISVYSEFRTRLMENVGIVLNDNVHERKQDTAPARFLYCFLFLLLCCKK